MNYLDYEEKLIVKEFVEKSYHSFKDKEKFNLLKGSLNSKILSKNYWIKHSVIILMKKKMQKDSRR